MKVACLQYAPQVGKLQDNMTRASALIDDAVTTGRATDLDWLLLPELALTGYNFHSLKQIERFLEPTAAGTSTKWALDIARKLGCHVTIGYPEQASDGHRYNSTVTISPAGQVLANYRKTFLYYTDELWAHEGKPGFFSGDLGVLGKVSMGICMDINPYRFTAAWEAYEFATACLQAKSPIIALNMAWLTNQPAEELTRSPAEPDCQTLGYWHERLRPLFETPHEHPPTVVIIANRSGVEGGVAYAGSSTVLKFESGSVQAYDILGQGQEELLVVDIDNDAPQFAVVPNRHISTTQ